MEMTPSPSAAALTVSELGLNDPTGLSKLIFAVASSGGRFIPRQHRIQRFTQVADHSGFRPSFFRRPHGLLEGHQSFTPGPDAFLDDLFDFAGLEHFPDRLQSFSRGPGLLRLL